MFWFPKIRLQITLFYGITCFSLTLFFSRSWSVYGNAYGFTYEWSTQCHLKMIVRDAPLLDMISFVWPTRERAKRERHLPFCHHFWIACLPKSSRKSSTSSQAMTDSRSERQVSQDNKMGLKAKSNNRNGRFDFRAALTIGICRLTNDLDPFEGLPQLGCLCSSENPRVASVRAFRAVDCEAADGIIFGQ